MAMQRVPHLGPKRVAGAEPAGLNTQLRTRLEESSPPLFGQPAGDHQFASAFAGVTGAADDRLLTDWQEGHVVEPDRQADRSQQFIGSGPGNRDHRAVMVEIGDLDPGRCTFGQDRRHRRRVGRVRDQQHLVGAEHVGD